MTRTVQALTVVLVVALALIVPGASVRSVTSQQTRQPNRVLERQALAAMGQARLPAKVQSLSSGVLRAYLEATGRLPVRAALATQAGPPRGVRRETLGCSRVLTGARFQNIRVNQDCSFRRQAEEFIAINPTDPRNLVAGQNDSAIGFNHCGVDFSFDRGRTWGTYTPPFWGTLLPSPGGARTTDAASDPAMAFDSQGNLYFTCIIFSINTIENGIVVMKSNAEFGGSFLHSPSQGPFGAAAAVVVAEGADPNIFHDKEFINADRYPGSPKRDNVYVTWTRFDFDTGQGVGAHSPIYFSQSTNGGVTWSAPIEISGANPAICTVFSGSANPNACDQDQGSWPEVAPNGDLYVFFGNGNTPLIGLNQILAVRCPAAADCSNPASWTAPVKVEDLVGTHPIATAPNVPGCPVGRQCLPPNGYRAPEFTSITGRVDPTDPSRLFVTWADFRNGDNPGSTCGNPPGAPLLPFAAATPPCDNDVFISVSTNGGATWSPARKLTPSPSAQWQPWSAVGPTGRLFLAYYDRQYKNCEFTGCNDITLVTSTNWWTASPTFQYFRVTTSSMPNLTTLNNPFQAGFLGDYMGIDADARGAVLVWGDTRGRLGTVEEDIYFAKFP